MKINVWVTKQDAVSGKITKYYNICPQQTNWPDFVQVTISQDEFARLEDNGSNNSRQLTSADENNNDWAGDHWLVQQYNRNRLPEDQVTSKEEIPYVYEKNPDTNEVYRRKSGDKHENRERVSMGVSERDYSGERGLEQIREEMKDITGGEFETWFHRLTKNEQSTLQQFFNNKK